MMLTLYFQDKPEMTYDRLLAFSLHRLQSASEPKPKSAIREPLQVVLQNPCWESEIELSYRQNGRDAEVVSEKDGIDKGPS
jgi:hypothetical protein